jgi:hypothetical protein
MRLKADTVREVIRLAGRPDAEGGASDSRGPAGPLAACLGGLSHEELIELMAVMSVGRGDPGSDDFQTLVNNIHLSAPRIVGYLTDKPYLGEDLEKGMAKIRFGDPRE